MNPKHIYEMNNQALEQVTEEKDLGVVIDNKLNFHKHAAAAVKKGNSILGMIKKSFIAFDMKIVPLLYQSLVRPHLEYGNVVWGPFYKKDIQLIEKVQRRASKLIPNIRNLTYEERIRELKLPSRCHRRNRGEIIYAYKLLKGRLNMK